MICPTCGALIDLDPGRTAHSCGDNQTGVHVGDRVRFGDFAGTVVAVQAYGDRGSAQVRWDGSIRAAWFPTTQLELVA